MKFKLPFFKKELPATEVDTSSKITEESISLKIKNQVQRLEKKYQAVVLELIDFVVSDTSISISIGSSSKYSDARHGLSVYELQKTSISKTKNDITEEMIKYFLCNSDAFCIEIRQAKAGIISTAFEKTGLIDQVIDEAKKFMSSNELEKL